MAEIEANWRQLDEVVARLTSEDLKRTLTSRDPEDPTWTIADAVLHIAAWEHRTAHEAIIGAMAALPDDRLLLDDRPRLWLAPVTWHPNSHLKKDILATLG